MAEQLQPDLLELNRHPEAEIQHADDFADYSLDELAQQINDGHQAVQIATRRLAVHVAQVGAWLTAAKAKCNHGQWMPWVAENCPDISKDTEENYRSLYEWSTRNSELIRNMGVTEAYKVFGRMKEKNEIPRSEGKSHWSRLQ